MSNTALPVFKLNLSPQQVLQGCVSYLVALTTFFAILFVVITLAQSILTTNAALLEQSQKIETIDAALSREKDTLAKTLQTVGLRAEHDLQNFSSVQTVEKLNHDTDLFIEIMQELGFRLDRNTPYMETPISVKLSKYSIPLTFSGDENAVAAFLNDRVEGDMRISALALNKTPSLSGGTIFNLDITLTQVGAASTIQLDLSTESANE